MSAISTFDRTAPRLAGVIAGLVLLASCSMSAAAEPADGFAATPAGSGSYTITAGDTLGSIASRSGVSLADLVATNGWADGSDHLILPGDVIALPLDASAPDESPKTSPKPAAPVTTASSSSDASSAASAPCDAQAILATFDGAQSVDGFACDGSWAGAGIIDENGLHNAVILRAGVGFWVRLDWATACDDWTAVPPSVAVYCPGG